MERDPSGIQYSDVAFCQTTSQDGDKSRMLATAISARVDIYSLSQQLPPPNDDDDELEQQSLRPSSQIYKFNDPVTALHFRPDGNLLLAGETTGRVQLFELKHKFALRTYSEHANRINSFAFAQNNRTFISCANETAIKLWDIQNSSTEAELSILAAHADNIKRVAYVDEQRILSASSDGMVKVWDLRHTAQAVSSLRFDNPVEDICQRGSSQLIVAHGNALSVAAVANGSLLEHRTTFYPFQKSATRVRYDQARDRVIAGGLDSQLKFFTVTNDHQVQVSYKIKVPSEIFSLDFSSDGNHFAMGLADGSLLIKSKQLQPPEEKKTAEQRIFDSFQPQMISTSKNYKYFFRGQYVVTADTDDICAPQQKRRRKLQSFEQHLKLFEYKQALNAALNAQNPEVVLTLIEELVERDALHIALSNRSEDEIVKLMDFLIWKLPDHRYANVLLEVARITLDMYSGVVGLSDRFDNKLFN